MPVAGAIDEASAIDPPRSWPKEYKLRFKSLPYDLKSFLARHDAQREKALRRAQNETAVARKKMSSARPEEPKDDTEKNTDEATHLSIT
jgi:hypothetical protein